MKPTFIICGGARCGTSWLYELCKQHPDIYMASPRQPEPKFFSVDREYRLEMGYYSEKCFFNTRGAVAAGEKSVSYLDRSDVVAPRIRKHLPGVKLIFILRNPIQRAFSHYLYTLKEGRESFSFEDALERERRGIEYPPELQVSRPFTYMDRGLYAKLLRPYFELFPPEQIKIILLDDVVYSPRAVALSLFEFLGVRAVVPESFDLAKKIHSAWAGEDMGKSCHDFLRGVFFYPNQKLAEMIGRALYHWSVPYDKL